VKYFTYILLLLGSLQVGCNDCSNCEPFTEEPFLTVRFYNAADSSRRVLVIDSVNQMPAAGFRHFNDTSWEFRLPLNMQEDFSEFNLVVRDTTHLDSINYSHFIRLDYERQFLRRDDNFIVTECNLTELFSNFVKDTLVCQEEDKCISNHAKASLYY
jgi:hypothetical protein